MYTLRRLQSLTLLIFIFSLSCKNNKTIENPLFTLTTDSGIDFTNTITNNNEFNIFTYRNFYNGGGVATGDINNDGLPDVFFTANMGSNKLYLNKGNFQFTDISEKAGISEKDKWSTGVVMVDINNDGWLDIYVCNAGYQKGLRQENALFINNKDLTFREAAAEYGLDNKGYTTHAAFFDYDMDGDLDCYILNNSFIPVNTLNYTNKRNLRAKDWPVADFLKGGGSFLMRNDGGKFVDVSEEAGIYGSLISFGLGVTVGDVNGDRWPDIYVSNDFFERDYLYINQKNGKYKEDLESCISHLSHSSMGADMADVNNDGNPDIFVTEMLPDDDYRLKTTTSFENIDVQRLKVKSGFYYQFMQNTLQLNDGEGHFRETAFYSGVAASDWSWGALMFDADNDGLSDIFVCNGINNDVTDQDFIDFFANDVVQDIALTGKKEEMENIISKMPSTRIPNKAFHNSGQLRFSDSAAKWGLAEPSFSNGASYADLDNDGDLDLIVNNINQKAFVYRNNSREQNKNNYISLTLKAKTPNGFAAGSCVKFYCGDQVIMREVIPSRGFQSSVDYKIVVGLGKRSVDSMLIIWPDQSDTIIAKPAINQLHTVSQTGTRKPGLKKTEAPATFLTAIPTTFATHAEDDFVDFYTERNIPMMISREGPRASAADVNNDGLEDIFIGGTSAQTGQLYLQTEKGFLKSETPEIDRASSGFEDGVVLFFDCDKDGDADLYIGAAGNNHPPNTQYTKHRLFINDGKGNFSVSENAFPANNMNIATAIAADFDDDGDLDLFAGGRSIPYNYGVTPASYLLINDGSGKFADMTGPSPDLSQAGLITGAVWADIDGDKKNELIVAGEWMAPKVFSRNGTKFTAVKSNLDSLYGLWQSIAVNDIDGDGDQDLVLGNIGENFYLHPDAANPVRLFINDFDLNGTIEKVLTRTVGGRDVPVFLKKDMTDQVASLKKQNLRYVDYAKKSVQDLFTADAISKGVTKEFNYSSSCIALNDGKGKFTIKKLPMMVQLSSVNVIRFADINNDGKEDILMGSNRFGFQPQFSRLDAGFGQVLINNGSGQYDWIPASRSGVFIKGETRDITSIKFKKGKALIFFQNNEAPILYQYGNGSK